MKREIINEIEEMCVSFDNTSIFEKCYIKSAIDYLNSVMHDNLKINKLYYDINMKIQLSFYSYLDYLMKRRDNIDLFMKNNDTFFKENILKVKKNGEYLDNKLKKLSDDSIEYIIEIFLKKIDMNLYNFYLKMYHEERILYGTSNNIILTSLHNSSSLIFVKDLKDLEDIMILIHELGHSYYYYINNAKIIERNDLLNELKEEIPAKILELKFIKFLDYYGVKEASYTLQELFTNIMYLCDLNRHNFENLKYLIASDIAIRVVKENFNVTKYFEYIYKSNIYDLLKELNNGKEKGKILIK